MYHSIIVCVEFLFVYVDDRTLQLGCLSVGLYDPHVSMNHACVSLEAQARNLW